MPAKPNEIAGHFAAFLRERREVLGLTQDETREMARKSQSWLAGIESGGSPPPNRKGCEALAYALNLPTNTVWNKAAPERLAALHPDLFAWHLEQFRTLADHTHTELLAELGRRLHDHPSR